MTNTIINRSYPDKKALITTQGAVSYSQLLKRVQQFAELYENEGYSKVAIYGENSPDWIYAFYSALQNNCIPVPVDFLASADDVAYIIEDCRPELLFMSAAMKESYGKIDQKIIHKPNILVFEEIIPDENSEESRWIGPEDPDTTAVIIYTSGTTGSPKGVMLSYTNIYQNMYALIDIEIYIPERQVLMFLPLHHVFPLIGSMFAPLHVGCTIPMAPSMQASDLMKTFTDNEIGIFLGVPRLYELMYRSIRAKIDTSPVGRVMLWLVMLTRFRKLGKLVFRRVHKALGGHLRFLVSGGAALNRDAGLFFHGLGFDILEGYGMTEAAPMITFPRPGRVKIGSVGEPLPGLAVEIRDGEVVAKGPSIMKGYYNHPEETAAVLREGWLFTGDLGYFDKDGFLYLTGRKKEIIVLPNGKNINPVEIEDKLNNYSPAVRESGVFLYKELLQAVIFPDFNFLAENQVKDIELYFRAQVISPFNAEMSSYKRIMQFTLVNSELPRTRLSKLQRFRFEELVNLRENDKSVSDEPNTTEYRAVKTFIESQVDMDIQPDHHLEFDISLDSLSKISLIDYVEKSFGIKLSEEQLMKFPSVRKIAEYIQSNKLFHKTGQQADWSGDLKDDAEVTLPKASFLMRPVVYSVRRLAHLLFSVEGKGMEHIPEGPCIFAVNHESTLDAFLVLSFLDKQTLKNTFSYAKKEHVQSRIRRFLAAHANVIVMDLSKDLKNSIQKMAQVVKQGKKVLIFPEGTRTKTGELGEFKKTYTILSTELTVPIVPVVISGSYEAMSSGKRNSGSNKRITLDFLPAVFPGNMNPVELNDLVKQKIADAKKEQKTA